MYVTFGLFIAFTVYVREFFLASHAGMPIASRASFRARTPEPEPAVEPFKGGQPLLPDSFYDPQSYTHVLALPPRTLLPYVSTARANSVMVGSRALFLICFLHYAAASCVQSSTRAMPKRRKTSCEIFVGLSVNFGFGA